MKRVLLVAALLAALSPSAFAHDVRPAYLELRQTGPETYDALWKVPARGDDLRLGIYAELPAESVQLGEPRGWRAGDAWLERWSLSCPGGLTGRTIRIRGLSSTPAEVLVRIERLDGSTQIARLTPASPSFVVAAAPRALQVVAAYAGLGVRHILTGADHLLFVLALILLTSGGWRLVQTVTAFTVAHSITLSAAALGFVHVPQPPVEAVIALSILLVAAEIVRRRAGAAGLAGRWPWLVALSFGLLHGLGFAGALSEIGLPPGHVPLALLCFNLGVEAGQLLFIGAALLLIALVRRAPWRPPAWMQLAPPYAIGGVAAFWILQRVTAF